MSTNTAIAKAEAPKTIRTLLLHDPVREKIMPLLPPGADYERVVAAAHFAVRKDPKILQCTPESIIDAVARIQQWQLEIGTTAYLVPFGKVCTPVAGYMGIAELMQRSGAVRHVQAHAVYKGDQFDYKYGTNAFLDHRPSHSAKERGVIVAAYVLLNLPYNREAFEVMLIEDIDAIRKQYSMQWKNGPCPAWYAKKTVVRQAAKLIPKDPRLADVLRVVNEDERAEFANQDAPSVLASGSIFGTLPPVKEDDETPATTAIQQRDTSEIDPDDPNYFDGMNEEIPL